MCVYVFQVDALYKNDDPGKEEVTPQTTTFQRIQGNEQLDKNMSELLQFVQCLWWDNFHPWFSWHDEGCQEEHSTSMRKEEGIPVDTHLWNWK